MTLPLRPAELLATAKARWTALQRKRPDLAPAIRLQRVLVRRQIETAAALVEFPFPPPLTRASLAAKLASGTPAFSGESVPLPTMRLGPLAIEMCRLLEPNSEASGAARRVRQCLEAGRLQVEALLHAVFARDQARVRVAAAQHGLAADLLWLTAELALVPFVVLLQEAWLGQDAAGLFGLWQRGYCPACGSWPALAESHPAVSLRCSFCGIAWPHDEERCVYCGASAQTVTPVPAEADRQLALCDTCRGYLKRVAVARPTPPLLLAMVDLATADLDARAAVGGYGRPPMPDHRSGDPTHPAPATRSET